MGWAVGVVVLLVLLQVYALQLMAALVEYKLKVAATQDLRVTCALSLIRSKPADTAHVVVLGHATWFAEFLAATDIPVSVQLGVKRIPLLPVHNLESEVVFLVMDDVSNRSFVHHALGQIKRNRLRYLPRVVVWSRNGVAQAQAAIDAAQDLEIVRLVVVTGTTKTFRVFGYRERCVAGSLEATASSVPVKAGECSAHKLFPNNLHRNMEGCALRVGFDTAPPVIMAQKIRGDSYILSGELSHLVYLLAERFNSSLVFKPPSDDRSAGRIFKNGSADGLVGDVLSKRCDLGFHEFTRTLNRQNLADLSSSHLSKCISLIVPSGLGRARNPWKVLFVAFRPNVWALILLSLLMFVAVQSFAWWRIRDQPVLDSAFYMLSLFLGNSPPFTVRVTRLSARLLLAHWLILSIVLTTGFQAVRHSMTAAPWKDPEIEDIIEIQEKGLKVFGHPTSLSMLSSVASESGDRFLLEFILRAEPIFEATEEAKRMAIEKDVALAFYSDPIFYHVAPLEKERGRRLIHSLPWCPIRPHSAAFMLRRSSHWTAAVSHLSSRAFECGITQHWEKWYRKRRSNTRPTWSQLSFAKLFAGFQLLVFGHAFGALTLFAETLVHKIRHS